MPPPGSIENGGFEPPTVEPSPIGSIVVYRCSIGWKIASGKPGKLRCLDDGTWSDEPPTCIGKNPVLCIQVYKPRSLHDFGTKKAFRLFYLRKHDFFTLC